MQYTDFSVSVIRVSEFVRIFIRLHFINILRVFAYTAKRSQVSGQKQIQAARIKLQAVVGH